MAALILNTGRFELLQHEGVDRGADLLHVGDFRSRVLDRLLE
jgi:hypothetical protein